MDVTLQSKTRPDTARKGIKYNDKWHTVIGKATNYIDTFNTGDIIRIDENENGDVIFMGKLGAKELEMTEKEVIAEDTADMTSVLVNMETIIKQNATLNSMLMQIMKKLEISTEFENIKE